MDEDDSFLFAPAGKRGVINPIPDGNAQVLVERHEPVASCGLLKDGALDRPSARRQCRLNVWVGHQLVGQACTPGLAQQQSCAGAGLVHGFKTLRDLIALRRTQQARDKGKAVVGEAISYGEHGR